MTRQKKILLANALTVVAAFATLICLFAMNGISFQTVVALAAAAGCAYITGCFFKVENILRKQNAKAAKQRKACAAMSVVRGAGNGAKVA